MLFRSRRLFNCYIEWIFYIRPYILNDGLKELICTVRTEESFFFYRRASGPMIDKHGYTVKDLSQPDRLQPLNEGRRVRSESQKTVVRNSKHHKWINDRSMRTRILDSDWSVGFLDPQLWQEPGFLILYRYVSIETRNFYLKDKKWAVTKWKSNMYTIAAMA